MTTHRDKALDYIDQVQEWQEAEWSTSKTNIRLSTAEGEYVG